MKYRNKSIQIACDGGAATGKSTGAKMISKKYNLKSYLFHFDLLLNYQSFCQNHKDGSNPVPISGLPRNYQGSPSHFGIFGIYILLGNSSSNSGARFGFGSTL